MTLNRYSHATPHIQHTRRPPHLRLHVRECHRPAPLTSDIRMGGGGSRSVAGPGLGGDADCRQRRIGRALHMHAMVSVKAQIGDLLGREHFRGSRTGTPGGYGIIGSAATRSLRLRGPAAPRFRRPGLADRCSAGRGLTFPPKIGMIGTASCPLPTHRDLCVPRSPLTTPPPPNWPDPPEPR